MQTQKDEHDLPKRHSLRLPGYDYTSTGAYFFTINTLERKRFFAIPELYQGLLAHWHTLPVRFPGVRLDEFVILPEHIHGIVWLDQQVKKPPTLSTVLGAYKSLTTLDWLTYHKTRGIPCSRHLWQRGYHDHVIRNDQDLLEKQQYILNNPLKEQEKKSSS
jgi:putative transposase